MNGGSLFAISRSERLVPIDVRDADLIRLALAPGALLRT